jgi:serine O-acetyltransferase
MIGVSPPRDSPWLKIAMDVEAWSRAAGRPATLPFRLRLVLLEPGFQLALSLRLQEVIGTLPVIGKGLQRLIWYVTTMATGCHIAPTAILGGGLYMPHPTAIVIGRRCRIGNDVTIYQQVTLGSRDDEGSEQPVLDNNIKLYVGATLLGGVYVGDDAIIGAKAVVLNDIPAGHVAFGIPASSRPRRVRRS